jgi:hypothetical protein
VHLRSSQWLRRIFRPEDLRFGDRATSVRAVEPVPPSQRPLGATLEMTAFQFQR